jgi:hypothetical protein
MGGRVLGKQPSVVRVVFGEKQRHVAFAGKNEFAQRGCVAATALVLVPFRDCLWHE